MKHKQVVNIIFRGMLCPKFDMPQSSGVVALALGSGTERSRTDAVVETP